MVIYSTGLFKPTGKEQHMDLFRVPCNPKEPISGQGYRSPLNFSHTNVWDAPLTADNKWTIHAACIHSAQGPLPCSNGARWRLVFNHMVFHQGFIHLYTQPIGIGPYEISNHVTRVAATIDLDSDYPIPESGIELTVSLWIDAKIKIG